MNKNRLKEITILLLIYAVLALGCAWFINRTTIRSLEIQNAILHKELFIKQGVFSNDEQIQDNRE